VTAALPAIPNFRDIGGLGTSNGPIRTGVVYRSAQLFALSPEVQQSLLDLGVSDVFDLRTAEESAHRPDTLPAPIKLHVDDVLADRPHSGAAEIATLVNEHEHQAPTDRINAEVGNGRAHALMIETYLHFVTLPSAHAGYRRLLTGIAEAPGASVLHCTAGKDRSGWAVAVLQHLAGAQWTDIVDDYLASNAPMRIAYGPMLEQFAARGGDADGLAQMMLVNPDYLQAAVDEVTRTFGGIEPYVARGLGVTDADVERLRSRLLA
jgi:protein-tyrosine phosphatase